MKIQLSDHFTYKKLIRFTLPSIVMMIVTSIYGIVDGLFVSNFVGKTAFSAVNLIMPVLMIVATIGFMFGAGGTAIVAKTFGEGNDKKANEYFSLFVYFSFAIGIVFAVLGIIFIRPIAILFKAEGELLEYCVIYARIILVALPFYILQLLFQSFFVTAEKPKLGLLVTVMSGVTNMVLDAVLVILLPMEYKLAGAALATAFSQLVGGVVPLVYFFRRNNSILRLGKTKFNGFAIVKACTNGSSEFMSNVSASIVGMLYNSQLFKYAGEDGIAAYGVMMYVSMIFCAAFIGYSIGTAPVVGYNYGSENHDELKNVFKKSLNLIISVSFIMVLAAELFASPLAGIFVSYDKQLFGLTVSGFRIFSLAFLFSGTAIFSSSFFTALNDGLTSALISFFRTLLFQVSAVILLPLIFDINGIWASIVVADLMAGILSAIFLIAKRNTYHYY